LIFIYCTPAGRRSRGSDRASNNIIGEGGETKGGGDKNTINFYKLSLLNEARDLAERL